MLELLFLPIVLLVDWPPLALLPAVGFGFLWHRRRRSARPTPRVVVVASLVWLAYAVYEQAMSVWAATVIAPIRVDLLVLGPMLEILTIWALWAWWRSR